jgi:1-acyl-sn-glycerol-3-phosphate acyltransferase
MAAILKGLSNLILRLIGWRTVFVPPPGPKWILLAYPHTSNWDFPLGLLFSAQHGVFVHWTGKDSLFRWPMGGIFRRIGGVAINRRERTGMIAQLTEVFAHNEHFHLCITPEGTRKKTDHWKSGFYRLAMLTGVPVGLGFFDYPNKRVGVERWVTLSGDEAVDLELFRLYYADKVACYPEKAGDIRFKS